MTETQTAYTICKARYRANAVVVKPTQDGSGFKTRAGYLAEQCGNWTHRDGGYSMSPVRAALFEKMYAAGFDGKLFGGLLNPDGSDWEGNDRTGRIVNGYHHRTRIAKWPTFPPTIDEMIAALRRGDRIRYTCPPSNPSHFRKHECDIVCGTAGLDGKAKVMLISVGPKGMAHWAHGRTFWTDDAALRDMYLNGLLDDGCNPRIVKRPKKRIAA